jgi:predicted transcriptional regulator
MDKDFVKSAPHPITEVLPYSMISEIAKEMGMTRSNVSQILKGEHSNPRVVSHALIKLKESKSKIIDLLAYAEAGNDLAIAQVGTP